MFAKIHNNGMFQVLAICDEDLIGKVIEDRDIKIEISESFYKGEKKNEKEVLKLMQNSGNINMIGNNCIKIAIDNGIIHEENVIFIKKIPHAQVVSL